MYGHTKATILMSHIYEELTRPVFTASTGTDVTRVQEKRNWFLPLEGTKTLL
jgi:hypothetical protein